MKYLDHPAKMAQQDPAFPDYDERGWPNPLVGVVLNVRDDALRLREVAARLIGKAPPKEVTFLLRLADSLDAGAAPAEKYMAETAGPGLQVLVVPARTDLEWLRLPEVFGKFVDYAEKPVDENALRIIRACAERTPGAPGTHEPQQEKLNGR